MARVFIFAEQVRKIVASGRKEIEIPEGARISSAAAELIKDKKLKIKVVAAKSPTAADKPGLEGKPMPTQSAADQTKDAQPSSQTTLKAKQAVSADAISDADLEALVNRVIERVKQLKGGLPSASADSHAKAVQPQSTPADDDDLIICRCEEITKGEIKEAIRNGMRTVSGIKRVTRAGMGLCQGQTCQRLVTQIIAEELGQSPAEIDPATARGPLRPLRMAVFANS